MWNKLVYAARRAFVLYMRLRGRRYWIAASPSGNVELGFLTRAQALAVGATLGKVAYVDSKECVIFFDTVPTIYGSHNTN